MKSNARSERAERSALLHAWLHRPVYERLVRQADEMGIPLVRLVQVALPIGAAHLRAWPAQPQPAQEVGNDARSMD